MEAPKSDSPKLPDMIMCGDHQTVTKAEVNDKPVDKPGDKPEEHDADKVADVKETPNAPLIAASGSRERAARRGARSLHAIANNDQLAQPSHALLQVALGSFRWPPYLVLVWVVVLLLAHLLHCVATLLDRALPALRQISQYFRAWAEQSWKSDTVVNQRFLPIGLSCLTAFLYSLYFALCGLHAAVLWALEPLNNEEDKDADSKVTNYVDDAAK